MLSNLNRAPTRVSWTLRALVVLGAAAVLALPAIFLSTTSGAVADDAKRAAEKVPAPEFLPPLTPGEEKILEMLEKPTTMDFTQTPLADAIEYLKDLHGMEIQLDTKALEEAGTGYDTPVTLVQNGVKLKSSLRLLLRPMGITYLVQDEVLLITSEDAAKQELTTRTYPVDDLAESDECDTLVKAIQETVRPDSWKESGGHGSIVVVPAARSVVVSQPRYVHDEVLTLLRALRAARDTSASSFASDR